MFGIVQQERRGLNISEITDSSRLVRYLTKKGANVDSSIKWKSIQHCDDPDAESIQLRNNHRQCDTEFAADAEANYRYGKLRRCTRTETVSSFTELLKIEGAGSDVSDLHCTEAGNALHAQEQNSARYSHRRPSAVDEDHSFCLAAIQATENSSIKEDPISHLMSSTHASINFESRRSCASIDSLGMSLSSVSSYSKSRSFCLKAHTAAEVTVLLIDIQGFTAECASLPAVRVGEWIAAFYSRVGKVAAAHGVQKMAVRGDCCICVAGLSGAAPAPIPRATGSPDLRSDQATRILAFAAVLHRSLASLNAGGRDGPTATRMGVATGEVSFLFASAAEGSDAAPFASVRGDAVDIAAQLEARATPGKVYVHRSTADKWAAETRRPPPPSAVMECSGGVRQRAAVYDCAAQEFVPVQDDAVPAKQSAVRRRASATF
jgi:class 3 adenylate cyclase